MSSAKELPRALSCTEIKQQWGIPSVKAQQDPEKELMKKKPLQDITFEKHLLSRDQKGGRKRRLVKSCQNSRVHTYSPTMSIFDLTLHVYQQQTKKTHVVVVQLITSHSRDLKPCSRKE